MLLFRYRAKGVGKVIVYVAIIGILGIITYLLTGRYTIAAEIIFFITSIFMLLYMIVNRYFAGDIKKLLVIAISGSILVLAVYGALSAKDQKENLQLFFNPESQVTDHWQDAYNSVLIKELLGRSKAIGAIGLSSEELMNYGTGEWHFNEGEVSNITKYLHYDKTNVTLENILPQYYHNNYRFACWVFNYGWIPAIILIIFVFCIYTLLFSLTRKIHNKIGRVISMGSSLCLAAQMLFYLAGNFGFQYGYFVTLPFVSEGLCSIIVNMILVGIILSAYRYDCVFKEDSYLKSGLEKYRQF